MLSTCNFVVVKPEHLCGSSAILALAYLLLAGVELGLVLQSEAELRVAVDGVDVRGEESRGEVSVAARTSPPEATARKKNM